MGPAEAEGALGARGGGVRLNQGLLLLHLLGLGPPSGAPLLGGTGTGTLGDDLPPVGAA